MNQEIHFKGLSLTPDDHHTQPGELSVCTNVELHNGALRPSVINGTNIAPLKYTDIYKAGVIPDSDPVEYEYKEVEHTYKLLYAHKMADGSIHLIASYKDSEHEGDYDRETGTVTHVRFFNEDGSHNSAIRAFDGDEIYAITSVGNTLVILTSSGTHYAKWNNGRYYYIGSHFPECDLSFGLQGRSGFHDNFRVTIPGWTSYGWGSDGVGYSWLHPESSQSSHTDAENLEITINVTEQVLSHVNKFISDYHDKGEFIFPFLIRYAYRLYDGSLAMHSAPVLMMTNSGTCPYVFARYYNHGEDINMYFSECTICAGLFKLDYQLLNASLIEELKNWSDIIKSVDIFISRPFYRYDTSGLVERINRFSREPAMLKDYCVAKATGELNGYVRDIGHLGDRYQRHDMRSFIYYGRDYVPGYRFVLPTKKDSVFNREIKECGEFFHLASIQPDKLSTERIIIDLKEGFYGSIKEEEINVGTIYSRELMTDDYESHDTIVAKMANVYNSRLFLTNIEKRLYNGYNPGAQFEFTDGLITPSTVDLNEDGIVNDSTDEHDVANGWSDTVQITYLLNENGNEIIVRGEEFEFGYDTPIPYVFYPNPKCYRAIIRRWTGYSEIAPLGPGERYFVVNMVPHPSLNGAIGFSGFETENTGTGIPGAPPYPITANPITPILNKLYASEISNPFYFPVENIVTIGLGTIVGLAGVTRALSPGQMGVHKIIALCTDGIWALTLGETGTISTSDRISFDTCVNKDSICQLGQSVLFASGKGVLRVFESDVSSVSDILDGPEFVITNTSLPNLSTAISLALSSPYDIPSLRKHPLEFLKEARLLYDFNNHRVIAFSATSAGTVAMVLSSDKSWSVMQTPNILACVNSYPSNYIQLTDGQVIRLDKSYDYSDLSRTIGIVVTRSISWSSTMQVIQGFQQIHDSEQAALLILYGSNDNRTWSYIGKSERPHASYLPGHPFRFFRVAILMQLKQSEIYSKLILDVKDKYEKL